MDRYDETDKEFNEQSDWRQFVGTAIALLRNELKHVSNKIDSIATTFNNGFLIRVSGLENKVQQLERNHIAYKRIVWGIFVGLFLPLTLAGILVFINSYSMVSAKGRELDYKISALQQRLDGQRYQMPPP